MHSAWQRYTRKPWVASASRFNKLFNPSSAGLSACSSCSQINEGRQPGVNTSVSMEALSLGDEWWPTFFFLSFLGKFGWLSYKTWKQKPTRFSLGRRQTLCSGLLGTSYLRNCSPLPWGPWLGASAQYGTQLSLHPLPRWVTSVGPTLAFGLASQWGKADPVGHSSKACIWSVAWVES